MKSVFDRSELNLLENHLFDYLDSNYVRVNPSYLVFF